MKKLVLAGTTLLLSVALMGCGNNAAPADNNSPNDEPASTEQNAADDNQASDQDATADDNQASDQDTTADDNQASDQDTTADDNQASDEESTSDAGKAITENNLEKYTALIGMTEEEVNVALDENDPATIDEGGLNYIVPGIRVWMTKDGEHVDQVFTNNYSADFKGAHVGDDLQKFIDAFGEPVSNENGTAEFSLDNGLALQAHCDENSNSVVAVYIIEK